MKRIFKLFTIIFLMYCTAFSQTTFEDINSQITLGNFTQAQQLIAEKIASGELSEEMIYDLKFQSQRLDRIRMDFSRDEEYVKNALQKYFPDPVDAQMAEWEKANELEMKIIDGEKRYFRNAVPNLFRKNKDAKAIKQKIDGSKKGSLEKFLESYLPEVVDAAKNSDKAFVKPQKFKITYTLTVNANRVPDGEIIRAWLPFPRSDHKRLQDVQLINTNEKNYIISPDSYPHKSIYFEKEAKTDEAVEFKFSATYTAYNEYHKLPLVNMPDYDTESTLFKHNTAERAQHIIFTPELKELSQEIVGDESQPLIKAKKIYEWIGKNIPWTSALEYSTIANIPMYCIQNGRGDCGIKSLLFITLCRYNGIPAKWQSGWFIYPNNLNLHDWAEIYVQGSGWVPVDPDFNNQDIADKDAREFFFGSADAYRLIINDDFSADFFPAKIHPRSETVDFQRGEAEWKGGNLYFNDWSYDLNVEYID